MKAGKPSAMVVAGVMSGTSADGVDVALVRVSPSRTGPRIEVLGHRGFAYGKSVRRAVLAAMDAQTISVAELSRLHWRLGEVYAQCVARACKELGVDLGEQGSNTSAAGHRVELIGLHGQTIYHQARAATYAGRPVRATWQIGEAAVVREHCGVSVVSDLRAADLAAGGQAAPLVPMLDFCLFRSATRARILLNLGGIANVTILPAGCALAQVQAFDTGPANMVMDALMELRLGKSFDRGGRVAAQGTVVAGVVERLLRDPYFHAPPPKSCGREQFGATFVQRLTGLCADASTADLMVTAAELTAQSIALACRRYASEDVEVIAAGGGIYNPVLMQRLSEALGSPVRTVDEFGVSGQAKEAVAFALLAWLSWHGLPGNVPSATGAGGERVLGKITW